MTPSADMLADIEKAYDALSPEEREQLDALLSGTAEALAPLMEFVPQVSPTLSAPSHLQPLANVLIESHAQMGTQGFGIEAVISCPPQHGKTQFLLHALCWLMLQFPFRHIYCTYSLPKAQETSKEFERIARRAGMQLEGNLSLWRNPVTGAEIVFAAVGGGAVTGRPCDGLFVVDDPFAGLAEARSPVYREAADVWFQGTATTRMHPGSSKLIVSTRWDPDDLSGRKLKEGYRDINLPAFLDGAAEMVPLWPEGRPREWLLAQKSKMRPSVWAALYLGRPVADGARVFGDVHYYEELPPLEKMNIAIGVDLNYTAKTSSDWSVAIVGGEYDARWYGLEAVRDQTTANVFAAQLVRLQGKYPGSQTRMYGSTTEIGTADIIRMLGVRMNGLLVHGDKLVRATPVSLAWNRGDVLLPNPKARKPDGTPKFETGWVEPFVTCVTNFTGHDDPQDDDVDALAAMFDQLPARRLVRVPKFGSPEWAAEQEKRDRADAQARVRQMLYDHNRQARRGRPL